MTNRSGLTWADKNGSLHKPKSYRLVWWGIVLVAAFAGWFL